MAKKSLTALLCCILITAAFPVQGMGSLTRWIKICVNGEEVTGEARAPYFETVPMVPLRIVAEKLGFTVTWEQATQTVFLDDGMVQSSVTIDKNSYYVKEIASGVKYGAVSLAAAPSLYNDSTTYVPARFFSVLGRAEDCITYDGHTMEITYPYPALAAAEIDNGPKQRHGKPFPWLPRETVSEAAHYTGISIKEPVMPESYQLEYVCVWDKELYGGNEVKLIYRTKEESIVYDIARDNHIRGSNYPVYTGEKFFKTQHFHGWIRGENDLCTWVRWTDGNITYVLDFSEPQTYETILAIVESVA